MPFTKGTVNALAKAVHCITYLFYVMFFCKGHYVYAEASGVKRLQVAKLQSKVYPGTPDGQCIEFAYSMNGWTIGALNVYVIDAKTGNQSKIFSKSGNQGKGWHRAKANIVSNADYKVGNEICLRNIYFNRTYF